MRRLPSCENEVVAQLVELRRKAPDYVRQDGISSASSWGGKVEHKAVRKVLPESYEYLFHQTGEAAFFLELGERTPAILRSPRLERAKGVLYLPESERQSHYFFCELASQFDAVFHFDRAHALKPLDNASQWARETPETYPFGV